MARVQKSELGKKWGQESAEEIRKQEIRRLRQMAAEAAAAGDRSEAAKLDRLADEAAQTKIQIRAKRVRPEQLALPLDLERGDE